MLSLGKAAETGDPIFAKHPPVPPGFTHQVVAPAGFPIPAISPAQSTRVVATERMFPFTVVLPILILWVIPCLKSISPEVGRCKEPEK